MIHCRLFSFLIRKLCHSHHEAQAKHQGNKENCQYQDFVGIDAGIGIGPAAKEVVVHNMSPYMLRK